LYVVILGDGRVSLFSSLTRQKIQENKEVFFYSKKKSSLFFLFFYSKKSPKKVQIKQSKGKVFILKNW